MQMKQQMKSAFLPLQLTLLRRVSVVSDGIHPNKPNSAASETFVFKQSREIFKREKAHQARRLGGFRVKMGDDKDGKYILYRLMYSVKVLVC